MGYEVWTNKDTYICSCTLQSKAELQEKMQECRDTISNCKERLKSLVYMTEPKKFYPEDDVQFYLNKDLEEIMEEYDEARIKLTRLWVFEEAWDETHDFNGRAILPVDPLVLKNQKTYMGGDYCEYVLENGEEVPEDWWDVYHGFVKPEDCSFKEIYGCEPKKPEIERDMTVGELAAIMKQQLKERGGVIEVNLDEL